MLMAGSKRRRASVSPPRAEVTQVNRRGAQNQPSTFARSAIAVTLPDAGLANAARVHLIRSVSVDRQASNVAVRGTATLTDDFANGGEWW